MTPTALRFTDKRLRLLALFSDNLLYNGHFQIGTGEALQNPFQLFGRIGRQRGTGQTQCVLFAASKGVTRQYIHFSLPVPVQEDGHGKDILL